MKTKAVNGWTISSDGFNFYVLKNDDRVSIKIDDPHNSELFYGMLTNESIRIFELNTFQSIIDIDTTNKTIHFKNEEYPSV